MIVERAEFDLEQLTQMWKDPAKQFKEMKLDEFSDEKALYIGF